MIMSQKRETEAHGLDSNNKQKSKNIYNKVLYYEAYYDCALQDTNIVMNIQTE